ncbi:MAG: GNAT family N-acetyltransferase [Bacteroidetes bacterium]|nr:GNAT family N-acetyltransferase [Bacteroidota bacterium]
MIRIERTHSSDIHFIQLTTRLDKELKTLYGSSQEEFDQYNVMTELNTVVIAYIGDQPVGCGCFKPVDAHTAEVKRMYVDSKLRGRGVGAAILLALENWARDSGFHSFILETGTIQTEAIRLYEKHRYQVIPNFEPYIGNELSICFGKKLV